MSQGVDLGWEDNPVVAASGLLLALGIWGATAGVLAPQHSGLQPSAELWREDLPITHHTQRS